MSNKEENSEETGHRSGLRDKLIFALTLLLVAILTAALIIFRDSVAMLDDLGYLGTFFISLAFNASIFLPMPILPAVFALGMIFNPVLIGLAAAAGGALGEISGYMAGYGGRGIVSNNKMYLRAEGWMKRWGLLTIFIFSIFPVAPFDLAGMSAGALRFPIWKFLLVAFIGKTLLYVAIAAGGLWGWEAVVRMFN